MTKKDIILWTCIFCVDMSNFTGPVTYTVATHELNPHIQKSDYVSRATKMIYEASVTTVSYLHVAPANTVAQLPAVCHLI